jgi:hypothetical protein
MADHNLEQSWDYADPQTLEKLQQLKTSQLPLKERLLWLEEITESKLVKNNTQNPPPEKNQK